MYPSESTLCCLTRDYTVVSGVLMIFSVAIVMVNLLIDLSYGYLDPRIRHERK